MTTTKRKVRPEIALLSAHVRERVQGARRSRDPLALAHALLHDDDAHVRATAALRVRDAALLVESALDNAPLVRAASYRSIARSRAASAYDTLAVAVAAEPVWWARRRAVRALGAYLPSSLPHLEIALGDPFWRVRHAAVRVALGAAADGAVVDALLARAPANEAHAAALEYLARRRAAGSVDGAIDARPLAPDPQPFRIDGPLYDPDPAVMTARLRAGAVDVDEHTLVLLFGDPHEPLRELALKRLLALSSSSPSQQPAQQPAALKLALTWLEDPRVPHATETALRFLDGAGDAARALALAVLLEGESGAHPRVRAWAASYAQRTHDDELSALAPPHLPRPLPQLPLDDARLARADARRRAARGEDLAHLASSDDPALRARAASTAHDLRAALALAHDDDAGVRAAVRARALRAGDRALEALVSDADAAVAAGARALLGIVDEGALADAAVLGGLGAAPTVTTASRAIARRALGSTGLTLPPLVVSGANDVADAALERALAAGADAYFWEPRYLTLTRFLRDHPRDVVVVAGSYEADAVGVARDIERALTLLQRSRIDVFLLFWARSQTRLDDGAFRILEREKRAGRIGAHGFSTHLRELALAAVDEQAWDVVMTRHSAAHPGAEDALFPACHARGIGVLSFSATSYGRLLREPAPTARDCYAYSLAQPGVTSVLSAPRYARELDENLALLDDTTLTDDRRRLLLDAGRAVRSESKDLGALVRRAPAEPLPSLQQRSAQPVQPPVLEGEREEEVP